ncbi:MAG TPA: hypothetical protein DGA22_05630 [Acidobacterium sp.]|nr:hypothetical protein [Acidobacterium sp.]
MDGSRIAMHLTETPPSTMSRSEQVARVVLLAALFSAIGLTCLRTSPGSDLDIWWQMRAGQWIAHHHAFPHIDFFSRITPARPWHAYSWLFELLTLGLYRSFGFLGLMAYLIGFMLAITVAMYRMVARLQSDFTIAILLTAAGVLSIDRLYQPRSWLPSILFFVIQLDLLDRARRSGQWRKLLWLLPLYALWANLHIQFIDGLVVLAATACEPLLRRFWPCPQAPGGPASRLFAILGGCIVAAMANPYGWNIYHIAYKLASEPGVINKIQELLAMPFRHWEDYTILALAVGSAAALARKRMPDLWLSLLLAMGLVISFRSQRDVWFLASVALLILASQLPGRGDAVRAPRWRRWQAVTAVLAATIAVMAAGGWLMHVSNESLHKKMAKDLPLQAVEFVKEKGYSGPLFNDYGWGGFLIWHLRMPVSIDGRAAFYGIQRMNRSSQTWGGQPGWQDDANLKTARLVIAPVKDALTQLLRLDQEWKLVYEDKQAAVFVRR